jgi:large subunit ribosomal protein L18
MAKSNKQARALRHKRLRKTVSGTPERPRMAVCCTGKHIYVQFVDDTVSRTLAAVGTADKAFRDGGNKSNLAGAAVLGRMAAEKAKAAQITQVVLDRGGFRYHGRVKAIAEAAREAGLQF